MLVYGTIAKNFFWEFDSIIMQNLGDILALFCTPTWPSHHVSENQELSVHFHVVIMCIKAILGSLKNDGAKDNNNAINQRYENKILLHVQHAL